MNKVNKKSQSIFFRLILIQVLSGVVILGALCLFIWFSLGKALEDKKKNFLFQLSEYVISELGEVPSYEKAISLSKKLGINISYKGTYGEWSTSQSLVSLGPESIQHNRLHMKNRQGLLTAYHFTTSSGEFYVTLDFFQPSKELWGWFALLLGSVVIVLIGNYRLLRGVLKPIEWLMDGVKSVADGNMEKTIPILSNDELGKLSDAFNRMSRQVKEMIANKEQLLLDVSHELRSPLTRMKVSTEFIADEKTKSDLSEDLQELEKMVDEILEIARLNKIDKLSLEEVNINSLLSRIHYRYKDMGPGVIYESVLVPLFLKIEKQLLEKAIRNVVDNACKYSQMQVKPVEMSLYEDKDMVVIKIIDYGSGISNDEKEKVFEPFYRTDKSRMRSTGGYGLGLCIAKRIVDAHAGHIHLESEISKGTEVRIELPKLLSL
jgi:signal transduction histidine kinase